MNDLSWDEFRKVDLRVGTIVEVQEFPEARKPAFILHIDFGSELGVKKSSAQITGLYEKWELEGKKVIAVINFPPKQIGYMRSECLVAGFYNDEGDVVLAVPDKDIHNGARLA